MPMISNPDDSLTRLGQTQGGEIDPRTRATINNLRPQTLLVADWVSFY